MEIKIRLDRFIGKLEDKSFPVVDEQVELVFESDLVLSNCVVKYDDGKNVKKVQALGLSRLVLPEEFKKPGVLYIGVDIIAKNQVAKHYDVEPLLFIEVDGELRFKSALDEYEKKLVKQDEQIVALREALAGLEARLQLAEQKVNEIWANEEM